MSAQVLGNKDVNASMAEVPQAGSKDVKSMDYHREMFQKKMAEEKTKNYISPSDNIMSPASAKISALRSKHAIKAKPKSLFAQASAKKLQGQNENPFGAKPAPTRAYDF